MWINLAVAQSQPWKWVWLSLCFGLELTLRRLENSKPQTHKRDEKAMEYNVSLFGLLDSRPMFLSFFTDLWSRPHVYYAWMLVAFRLIMSSLVIELWSKGILLAPEAQVDPGRMRKGMFPFSVRCLGALWCFSRRPLSRAHLYSLAQNATRSSTWKTRTRYLGWCN